jgi:Replication stress response SDE2 C-terminal/Silencing defective 2 N-terminal ubiquitin domain/SPRY domain
LAVIQCHVGHGKTSTSTAIHSKMTALVDAAIPQHEADHDGLQLLISFENRTLVHDIAMMKCVDDMNLVVRQLVAHWTGWPLRRLEATVTTDPSHWRVRVISGIRGGKGGFGTLLKGQAKQAGAVTTVNFGACRDLQGRRLQQVNEVAAAQHYQIWSERVQAGQATTEEMARALALETTSGVAGWYLPLPSWAAVSKSTMRQQQMQYRQWKRQRDQQEEAQRAAKERKQQQTDAYVQAAAQESAWAARRVKDALAQGLREKEAAVTAAASAATNPVTDSSDEAMELALPSSMVTISGDFEIGWSDPTSADREEPVWLVQSRSTFATLAILWPPLPIDGSAPPAGYYYEVRLVTAGLAQIGWARPDFAPNSDEGDGVGDDAFSWSYDASRKIALHSGVATTLPNHEDVWKPNDVVGCRYQPLKGGSSIQFTLNGRDCGMTYTVPEHDGGKLPHVFPALSCNQGEILELCLHASTMKYQPAGTVTVGEALNRPVSSTEARASEPAEDAQLPESKPEPAASIPSTTQIVVPEALNLDGFASSQELEGLGLDRLKSALMAAGLKCGGTLQERADRLFSIKGLDPTEYPAKIVAKRKRRDA